MSSPVTGEDFPPLSSQTSVCARLSQVLGINTLLETWFNWMFDENGVVSDEFVDDIQDRITPIGTIILYCDMTPPSNRWRLCNGDEVSRTTYETLWERTQGRFGNGDGVGTFNLPDMRGLFPIGAGGAYAIGSTGGFATVKLEIENLPPHTHVTTLFAYGGGNDMTHGGQGSVAWGDDVPASGNPLPTTSSETGGALPHENIPPFAALGYFIKVL